MKFRGLNYFIVALTVVVTTIVALPAKANITITPTLVVIQDRQRYADVYVVNTLNEPQTYELEWKFLRMEDKTGHYLPSDTSLTDFDLSQNMVFTPRRVTIEPRGMQKVRLALRLKGTPPPAGDYRIHLSLLNKVDRSRASQEILGPGESQASVGMNVGFSIPVIYRVGDGDTSGGKIGQITTQINQKTNKIEALIPIDRNPGLYGSLGELLVNYNGDRVGQIANANIFPESNSRTFRVPLSVQSLAGGRLTVIYQDQDKKKNKIFDERSVDIAK